MEIANHTSEEIQAKEIFEKNYTKIRKSGKLYLILILATIPNLCCSSLKLHVVKIGVRNTLKCQIPLLNKTVWVPHEALEKPVTTNKECFVMFNNDYERNHFSNISSEDAKNIIFEEYPDCDFYSRRHERLNKSLMSLFMEQLHSYCDSLKYELYYDMIGTMLPIILSCLIVVPFADIRGRNRTLALACCWVYIGSFLKFVLLDFTREAPGESIINLAHPLLKYATQAIVVEVTGSVVRPLAFAVTFLGTHVPVTVAYLANLYVHSYWHVAIWIASAPVLLLPIVLWYMPESPVWLSSRRKFIASQCAADTLGDSVAHSEKLLLPLRSRSIYYKDYKEFVNEVKGINILELVSVNVLSVCVGMLWFHPYSRHKLTYTHFKNGTVEFLYPLSGLFGVLLSIPCVYCMSGVRWLLTSLFFVDGVLFAMLTNFYYTEHPEESTFLLIISFVEIVSIALRILFEFYLQELFPTSHRCTCTAFCGASSELGLALLICFRHLVSANVGEIASSAMCFVGCISSLFIAKNLKRFKPLLLTFDESDAINV